MLFTMIFSALSFPIGLRTEGRKLRWPRVFPAAVSTQYECVTAALTLRHSNGRVNRQTDGRTDGTILKFSGITFTV